jgi:hypothetical protein
MVRRRHVDVPGLDRGAIPSKGCRQLPAHAQQTRQSAWMGAGMHNDKDRRRARNRQRRDDAPEGIKATGRSRNDDNADHSATLNAAAI